jgi:hypothetical protein
MRIKIDLPVFCSPSKSFGYASGELEVISVPEAGSVFSWPDAWITSHPHYFADEQSRVWNVSESGTGSLITMYGIVCESLTDARDCASFLKSVAGLEFNEH